MSKVFEDLPEAIDNTNEIVDKVELLNLKRDILLPNFPFPKEYPTEMVYLRHITMEGAQNRYGALETHVEERLNFESRTRNESIVKNHPALFYNFTTQVQVPSKGTNQT